MTAPTSTAAPASTAASFLVPVDSLPAEGADLDLAAASPTDHCAALVSGPGIHFDVSRRGATVLSNPQEASLWQGLEIASDSTAGAAPFAWQEQALEIQWQQLFSDRLAFSTLSDASEPIDCVRRFLEVAALVLDDPAIGPKGARVPLIRWEPGEDGESARVQLLALLLADEAHFENFCHTEDSELGLIFEDAEVEARGLRETVTVLTLLAVTLGSVPNAEASGFFKNLRQKKADRIHQTAQQEAIRRAPAPVPSRTQNASRSGWQDAHQDAYINRDLLAVSKDAPTRLVIDIAKQRAYLIVNHVVALDTAVSTARSGKHTPRGEFKITERVRTGKVSTIYDVEMPYWQRLDDTAIGLHIGDLPGYPASAGCIRLPHSVAPILFEHTARGTTVEIVDSWNMQDLHQQVRQQELVVAQVVRPGEAGDAVYQ